MIKLKKKIKLKFWRFQGKFDLEGHQFFLDLYVTNTWFKFGDKNQNTSKVIVFSRNHIDDDDADDDTCTSECAHTHAHTHTDMSSL